MTDLYIKHPAGEVPTRHHGLSINVTKDSGSATVTVQLEVNIV